LISELLTRRIVFNSSVSCSGVKNVSSSPCCISDSLNYYRYRQSLTSSDYLQTRFQPTHLSHFSGKISPCPSSCISTTTLNIHCWMDSQKSKKWSPGPKN